MDAKPKGSKRWLVALVIALLVLAAVLAAVVAKSCSAPATPNPQESSQSAQDEPLAIELPEI